MAEIVEEEKKIGRLLAEAFELTIAENFFSTQIPADRIDAAAVVFNGSRQGNYSAGKVYSAQVLGRYRKREDALAFCGKIDDVLPLYSSRCMIVKDSDAGIYSTSWNGQDAWGVSLNLKILVHK